MHWQSLDLDVDGFQEQLDDLTELFPAELGVGVGVADREGLVEVLLVDGVALVDLVKDFSHDLAELCGLEVAAPVVVVGVEERVGHLHHVGFAHHLSAINLLYLT